MRLLPGHLSLGSHCDLCQREPVIRIKSGQEAESSYLEHIGDAFYALEDMDLFAHHLHSDISWGCSRESEVSSHRGQLNVSSLLGAAYTEAQVGTQRLRWGHRGSGWDTEAQVGLLV